jgi:hypothetical protein
MSYARIVQLAAFGILTASAGCDDEILMLNFPRDASAERGGDSQAASDSAASDGGEGGATTGDGQTASDGGPSADRNVLDASALESGDGASREDANTTLPADATAADSVTEASDAASVEDGGTDDGGD